MIFKLVDVDEDGCLQVSDLYQLFCRIERNFCKELACMDIPSITLLMENANKRAYRNYLWAVKKLSKKQQAETI